MEIERKTCFYCDGNGRTGGHECPFCDGKGYIEYIVHEKEIDPFWDKLNLAEDPDF